MLILLNKGVKQTFADSFPVHIFAIAAQQNTANISDIEISLDSDIFDIYFK